MTSKTTALPMPVEPQLIQFPSGRWGFVGRVPATLAYICKDGSTPSKQQFENAHIAGPHFAGLKARAWDTRSEAETALEEFRNLS
jgi:hypothetical protein